MSSKLIKLLDQLTKLHPKYIDLSLGRLNKLLNNLGNPQFKLPPTIHIAGTNGKGSTLSFISNILKQNNYLVHSYISPHLKSFEERITISNKQISKYKLYNLIKYVHKINSNKPITFFEITTAAAFLIFSQEKADFLVLETGLGGRLDATNAIDKSILDIITPISIDHKGILR
jgi:folylpolyglutamate synthase/dihydrofolate synthase